MAKLRALAFKLVVLAVIIAVLVVAAIIGRGFVFASRTIFDLLGENKELKRAITNLTAESQIGYARVVSQSERDGRRYTRLQFVETARDDPAKRILDREYEIEGDVVYFDALIVKFGNEYVMDGRERALFLWRRIFSEKMAPESGYSIEQMGVEPKRYADIFRKLPLRDREMFWSEIWELSNDLERLKKAGIQAIDGVAVYRKLRPGLIYVFKIRNTGEVYVEAVPDL